MSLPDIKRKAEKQRNFNFMISRARCLTCSETGATGIKIILYCALWFRFILLWSERVHRTIFSFDFFAENSHLNLFSTRPQPKKKRKSRTAFTNHQIFELEKRFLYQKYLSPADRDEIASSLGLSNAQVSSWLFLSLSPFTQLSSIGRPHIENSTVSLDSNAFLIPSYFSSFS